MPSNKEIITVIARNRIGLNYELDSEKVYKKFISLQKQLNIKSDKVVVNTVGDLFKAVEHEFGYPTKSKYTPSLRLTRGINTIPLDFPLHQV